MSEEWLPECIFALHRQLPRVSVTFAKRSLRRAVMGGSKLSMWYRIKIKIAFSPTHIHHSIFIEVTEINI
jgi:hypothetical protein